MVEYEPYEVLLVEDIADELRTSTKTVYRMLGSGTLPGFKMGGCWRMYRSTLNEYLANAHKAPSGRKRAS